MTELYYKTPSDEVFDEVKKWVLKVFESMEWKDSFFYKDKEKEIKPINNIKDNIMCLIAMLSWNNLPKLAKALSKKAKTEIYFRLRSVNAYETGYFK